MTLAYAQLLDRQPNTLRPSPAKVRVALALLIFSAVVFRAELALLAGALGLQALLGSWLGLNELILTALISGVGSVCAWPSERSVKPLTPIPSISVHYCCRFLPLADLHFP